MTPGSAPSRRHRVPLAACPDEIAVASAPLHPATRRYFPRSPEGRTLQPITDNRFPFYLNMNTEPAGGGGTTTRTITTPEPPSPPFLPLPTTDKKSLFGWHGIEPQPACLKRWRRQQLEQYRILAWRAITLFIHTSRHPDAQLIFFPELISRRSVIA